MTELILHMNNYSIIGAIIAYQTYPYYYIIPTKCDKFYYAMLVLYLFFI